MYKITIKTSNETLFFEIEELDSPELAKIMENPDIVEFKLENFEDMKLVRKNNNNERRNNII